MKIIEIQTEAKHVISDFVLPAFQKLNVYIREVYMRHLRPTKATPGLLCVPNGLKMYQTLLELYTSIDGITAGKSYIREYFIFEK